MTPVCLAKQKTRHPGFAGIAFRWMAAASVLLFGAASYAQQPVRFDKSWWNSMDKNQHWDFVYGFTDCPSEPQSTLNTQQYEDFVSAHVSSDPNSVPKLIQLAPRKVKALPQTPGGEVWTGRHTFNNGDLWFDPREGRAWVEGYLACEHRPAYVPTVDRYVQAMLGHYADPKRHMDKLADVLGPLLPAKKAGGQP